MAYATVDVDLDEFSTSEILDELKRRKGRIGKKGLTDYEWSNLVEVAHQILNNAPTKITMVNQMKVDFLMENIEKTTLESLEKLVA